MENPFRSMIFDVAKMLPESCKSSFIEHVESLMQNSGGFNRAFAIVLICAVWIMTVPGLKRRNDAEVARELAAAKRLKELDKLIDSGRIIPLCVRWPLLIVFIVCPLLTGAMMIYMFRAGANELYWRPMASGPGFTIHAPPGEDPVCYLYSPATEPRIEEWEDEGWYVITPFILPPKLRHSTEPK